MEQHHPPKTEVEAVIEKLASQKLLGRNIRHDRGRSIQDLADLEMTGTQRDEVIFALTATDFSHCQAGDAGFGKVYVFGVNRLKIEIYIKLGNVEKSTASNVAVHCISFHKSAHPLKYPYRDSNSPRSRNQHN